jgi:two-component system chemotaxis response regulator CheY
MTTKRVLIADDSDKLLNALRIQLEAHGMEVTACSDAYMALAHAQKLRPDVMVLDIRMPAGDGFSVLERMRKIPEIRGIPVIYITGDKSSQIDLRAEQLGAHGVIHKPISIAALLRLIKKVTEQEAGSECTEYARGESQVFEINSGSESLNT